MPPTPLSRYFSGVNRESLASWWDHTPLEPVEDDAGDDRKQRFQAAAVAVKNMVNDTDRVPSSAANKAYAAKYWVSTREPDDCLRAHLLSTSSFALLDFTRAVRACHTQAWAEMNDMTEE
jgi:hypothetical protein